MFKMIKYLCYLFLSSALIYSAAEKLPSYLTQCRRSDPNLNECIIKSANAAIPTVCKGDKKYKIPVLSPLKVNEISISPNSDFHIGLKDVKIYGFEHGIMTKADIDPESWNIHVTIEIPRLEILGQYEAKGRISILPFEGQGPSNITIIDGTYTYSTKLVLEKKKTGLEHGKSSNIKIDYDAKKILFNFENLVTAKLGTEINKFLNENWMDLYSEFKPPIVNAISLVATAVTDPFLEIVPMMELFGP